MKKDNLVIKKFFDVKVECMLPSTLIYKVLAEDAQQAAEMIKNLQPRIVKYKLVGRREIKLTVFESGCSVIKLILNLFHRIR